MNLYGYFEAIAKGKLINGPRFKQLLEDNGIALSDICRLQHVKGNNYIATITNDRTYFDAVNRFKPPVDRVEATEKGNSHRKGTNISYLVGEMLSGSKTPSIL